MDYGLNDDVIDQMRTVFGRHDAVRQVIMFGSRAMETHRTGSDIDLAIVSDTLTRDELLDLQIQLEELGFLYEFDVKDLKKIKNPDLITHIKRVGKVLYEGADS